MNGRNNPCSVCLAAQVGVPAPHDDVRNLHCHHEVGLILKKRHHVSQSCWCVLYEREH